MRPHRSRRGILLSVDRRHYCGSLDVFDRRIRIGFLVGFDNLLYVGLLLVIGRLELLLVAGRNQKGHQGQEYDSESSHFARNSSDTFNMYAFAPSGEGIFPGKNNFPPAAIS